MSAMPNVVVQVLPFKLGAHPALESNFTILELPDQTPDIVFVEGLIGSIYLERDNEGYSGDRGCYVSIHGVFERHAGVARCLNL
jgi:hypothetical protein